MQVVGKENIYFIAGELMTLQMNLTFIYGCIFMKPLGLGFGLLTYCWYASGQLWELILHPLFRYGGRFA